MADKMMKIAARGDDGLAKAVKADSVGNMGVKLADGVGEGIERAVQLIANIRQDFYVNGTEYKAWIPGRVAGNGSQSKEEDHLKLSVATNPTNVAERGYVSQEKIDLTNIDTLYFDVEASSSLVANNKTITVLVSDIATQGYWEVVPQTKTYQFTGTKYTRRKLRLNVAAVTGAKYIRIHVSDTSATTNVPIDMKVYGIWGVKDGFSTTSTEPIPTQISENIILAKNVDTGESEELTSVSDENGKHVLRVYDAAPWIVEISKFSNAVHTTSSVVNASMKVLSANANRKYGLIVNNSESVIFLSLGVAATVDMGVLLLAKGASFEMSSMKGNLFKGDVFAIQATATPAKLLVTEGV